MGAPIGGNCHLGIRKELSFASGGAITDWVPIYSESVELNHENLYTDSVQNTSEQVGARIANRNVSGTITFPVTDVSALLWWESALGQSSTPYYITRPLCSLAIEIDRETDAILASGCMVGSMTVSSSQGAELVAAVDIEGADLDDTSAGDFVLTSGDPYLHSDCTFSLAGTDDTSITAWSLNVNNNLVTDLYGTQQIRSTIPATKLIVTGSYTKLFDDTTERDKFLDKQPSSIRARYRRGTKGLTFLCNKIRYDTRPANITGPSDYILETFNFTAYVDNPSTEYSLRISGDIS